MLWFLSCFDTIFWRVTILYPLLMFAVALLTPACVYGLLRFADRVPIFSYWLLAIVSIVLFVSIYVPSPLIDGENTNFGTHFVAGVAAGMIGYFLMSAYSMMKVFERILFSLAIACTLGFFVEIVELFLSQVGLISLTLRDTSWDLLADISGSIVGVIIFGVVEFFFARKNVNGV